MHRSRLLILAGTAIAAGALFLPHLRSMPTGSVNGITGDSWPAAAVLGLAALLAVTGDRGEGFGPVRALAAIGLAAAAVLFTAVKLADASRAADLASGSIGYGIWVMGAGALVVLAGALLSRSRKLG